MSTCTILLNTPTGPLQGDIIAVEQGALYCAQNQIQMSVACGDFDSVSAEDIVLIKQYADTFEQLDSIKDDTDFEVALKFCKQASVIIVYGALGRRIDHELVNLFLCFKDPRIILLDDKNKIQSYGLGDHIFKQGEYKYFSILPMTEAIVTLEGFKYPLFKRKVNPFDTYLSSNEIITEGTLSIYKDKVLVVLSND